MTRSAEARRAALRESRLYVVSDARNDRGDLDRFLDAVLQSGASVVQLREKHADDSQILRWALSFRAAADRHAALFVLNDRVDLAIAADADGVHVGQDDLHPDWVRRIAGEDMLIGLSTHSADQFDAAAAAADYLCIGPVHETPTKPGRTATGIEAVRHAASSAQPRPWFAIGGIDTSNVRDVVGAGARRVAVVRAVTAAADAAAAVRALLAALPDGD
jgi:thiamine-phosphate pyrophosphorylase